jgi:beta-N-acetylglucosaminidase
VNKNDRDLREKRVLELRAAGMTYQQIASECGFKYTQQVYQILARNGVVETNGAQRRKLTNDIKEAICNDRVKNKLTYVQLSVKYGCSTVAINKVLRENGLTGE